MQSIFTLAFVLLSLAASPTRDDAHCFNIADRDERGNYIEACEVTSARSPKGVREFDVTWCIESEHYNECGGTERPWGCDLTQGDDITVCILTMLDGACCGCISGCGCDEDCGEEESPMPDQSMLDVLTSQVGPVSGECESWNDGVHCGAACDAGSIVCGYATGKGSLCLAFGPNGDAIGRVDLPGNICG